MASSQSIARFVFLALSLFLLAEGAAMNFGYIRGFALGAGGDIDQDYCAAKAILLNKSVYADLNVICDMPAQRGRNDLANYHPPINAVLLLPFALCGISLQAMFFGWGLAMLLLYAAIAYKCFCLLGIAEHLRLVLLGFALLWFPQISHSQNGQITTIVLALVFWGWLDLRQSSDPVREWRGGFALGAACAVKVFPGLLGLYLLAARRYKAAAAMIGGFLALQVVSAAVAGPRDLWDYYTRVMPEDSQRYLTYWNNQSLTGNIVALLRVHDRFENLFDWPTAGPLLAAAVSVALVAHATWLVWRSSSKPGGKPDLDHAFWHFMLLAVMLCPISWDHTLLAASPLCVLLLARFGAANRLEWVIAIAAALLIADIDDLSRIHALMATTPKLRLADLWQAKPQLLGMLPVLAISVVLLANPKLAERAPRRKKQPEASEAAQQVPVDVAA